MRTRSGMCGDHELSTQTERSRSLATIDLIQRERRSRSQTSKAASLAENVFWSGYARDIRGPRVAAPFISMFDNPIAKHASATRWRGLAVRKTAALRSSRRFESFPMHFSYFFGDVAQWIRAARYERAGCRFESFRLHHFGIV